MTSAATAGYQGQLSFGASPTRMVQVSGVDLTINGETYDITVMTGTSTPAWKLMLAGLKSWTLKVTGFYDQANDTVQGTLWSDLGSGTALAITFSPNAGTNGFTGTALVNAFSPKFAVNAAENIEIDLTGTGALAFA